MIKNFIIIVLCILFNGCTNTHLKKDKNSEKIELQPEQYLEVSQKFFELRRSNFRKDGWFYSFHPEYISYPKECILLSKKAPETDDDRLIYKIDCFGKKTN
ncbi:hypothetical protein [Snodgrassella sp. ESL0253]|uniref:hypothetical protein n=1 Tax=Snodgrassella sp. ESL0253 TaxID=2705031 RepID=UPI001582D4CD|nr:hypothetical protein [Snodgrassella sp. ESL0253]NUE67756.1 hypothetical protein [Snodgrassella sp. ESL0253]